MNIDKIGIELKFRCATCGQVISVNAQTPDGLKLEGGEKELIEYTRGLVENLDQYWRRSGHDRTQHSTRCPEYRAIRTIELNS